MSLYVLDVTLAPPPPLGHVACKGAMAAMAASRCDDHRLDRTIQISFTYRIALNEQTPLASSQSGSQCDAWTVKTGRSDPDYPPVSPETTVPSHSAARTV